MLLCSMTYLEGCDVYLGTNADSRLKTRVLGKAVAYGDEWLGNESVGKREDEITALPTGNQVVPNYKTRMGLQHG